MKAMRDLKIQLTMMNLFKVDLEGIEVQGMKMYFP